MFELMQIGTPDSAVGIALTALGAIATSSALAFAKKKDVAILNVPVFRKLQPMFTLVGALATPWLAGKLGMPIDASAFGAAPLTTLLTVMGAEMLAIIKRST